MEKKKQMKNKQRGAETGELTNVRESKGNSQGLPQRIGKDNPRILGIPTISFL